MTNERTFKGVGGLRIASRSWRPESAVRGIVILIHGFNSHSGYMAWPAEQFAASIQREAGGGVAPRCLGRLRHDRVSGCAGAPDVARRPSHEGLGLRRSRAGLLRVGDIGPRGRPRHRPMDLELLERLSDTVCLVCAPVGHRGISDPRSRSAPSTRDPCGDNVTVAPSRSLHRPTLAAVYGNEPGG